MLLGRGNLQDAEAEARRAVNLSPKDPAYLGLLGAVLGMEQKLPESTLYLERALSINPGDVRTRRNLASNQFQAGQFRTAKENLERVLKAEPGESTSILLLGMVDEELKDYQHATTLLASVPQEVQKHPRAEVALARCYYHTGEASKAREVLRELENRPAEMEGIFQGGQVANQAGDYALAERMFRSIQTSYPDRAKLAYSLALAQYRAGSIAKSQATLQGVSNAGDDSSDSENLMAWCLFKQDRIKDAVAHMDRAIALDPSRESNYLDVGMMLLHNSRYNGALAAARKAVEVAPDSYQAYRLLGAAQYKLGELKAAGDSYARAVALNASDRESLLGLASTQVDAGDIGAAESTFERAIARFPSDANLYLQYGKMLLVHRSNNGNAIEAQAVALLKRAISFDGSLAEAHFELGNLELSAGRVEQALPELEVAEKLDPKPSRFHYALARAYLRLGRRSDGMSEMRLFQKLKANEKASDAGEEP